MVEILSSISPHQNKDLAYSTNYTSGDFDDYGREQERPRCGGTGPREKWVGVYALGNSRSLEGGENLHSGAGQGARHFNKNCHYPCWMVYAPSYSICWSLFFGQILLGLQDCLCISRCGIGGGSFSLFGGNKDKKLEDGWNTSKQLVSCSKYVAGWLRGNRYSRAKDVLYGQCSRAKLRKAGENGGPSGLGMDRLYSLSRGRSSSSRYCSYSYLDVSVGSSLFKPWCIDVLTSGIGRSWSYVLLPFLIVFCANNEVSGCLTPNITLVVLTVSMGFFSSFFDTVSSLFGLCSHKVDGVVRVWQCGQTASLPRMVGGASC